MGRFTVSSLVKDPDPNGKTPHFVKAPFLRKFQVSESEQTRVVWLLFCAKRCFCCVSEAGGCKAKTVLFAYNYKCT